MRHPLKIQNFGIVLVMGRIANAIFRWARFAKALQGIKLLICLTPSLLHFNKNATLSEFSPSLVKTRKHMKQLVTLFFILVVSGIANAQSAGHLHYEMEFSSDNPDMAMALPMMVGSTMDLYFMPEKSKLEMAMGTFMKTITTVDVKTQKGLMLMEIMGSKSATEINLSNANAENATEPKTIVTNETKSIIGYNCTKIIVQGEDGSETTLWVTNELEAPLKEQKYFGNTEIEGVPLEFTTLNKEMTIHFTATKYDGNVDANTFSMEIPEGYTMITEEEMKNMGQGF